MAGMNNRIRMALLRSNQWVADLSTAGRGVLIVIGMVVVMTVVIVAGYFGLIPSRDGRYSPHSLIRW